MMLQTAVINKAEKTSYSYFTYFDTCMVISTYMIVMHVYKLLAGKSLNVLKRKAKANET